MFELQIYDSINEEIRNLIQKIVNENIEDEKIKQSQKQAQKILFGLQIEVEKEINDLKLNSEWDTFTMAFYGETNAGKSTLIETLRILLNEKTKSETRKKFRILIAEIKNMNNEVNSINKQIEEKKIEINDTRTKINENIEEKEKYIICNSELEIIAEKLKNVCIEYNVESDEFIIMEDNILKNVYSSSMIKKSIDQIKDKCKIAIQKIEEENKIISNKILEKHNIFVKELEEILEKLHTELKMKKNKRNLILKLLYSLFGKEDREEKLIEEKEKILTEEKERIKESLEIQNEKKLELINKEKENKKLEIDTVIKEEKNNINNKFKEYIYKIKENRKKINEIEISNKELSKTLKKEKNNIESKEKRKKELERETLEKESALEKYQDGMIIGNGLSDFTRENIEYKFDLGNQKFNIIDMPGIEGKEEIVVNSITRALKKAHMVFYVTRKAAPPQAGDENRKGTIEKIKEQLGSQTEVRTIYNKSITNKKQLSNVLITEDEKIGLKEMDKKMKEILKDNYVGSLVISAKLSYLAISECLLSKNIDYKKRSEFLDSFSAEKLLNISGMKQFFDDLERNLVFNYKEKIKKSNYNKIKYILNKVINHLDENEKNTAEISKKFKEQIENSKEQINNKIIDLENKFYKIKSKTLNNFLNTTTKEVYDYIDRDITKSELEKKLKEIIIKNQTVIEKEFKEKSDENIAEFKEAIKEIANNLKKYLENILSYNFKFNSIDDFEINLDIDIGVKIGKLLMVIIGGILMFWNPMGWVGMTLGAISIFLGVIDAIGGFFSKEHKKAQQRKSVDRNIKDIVEKLNEKIDEKIDEVMFEIKNKMKVITHELEIPLNQIKKINEELSLTKNKIMKISKEKIK